MNELKNLSNIIMRKFYTSVVIFILQLNQQVFAAEVVKEKAIASLSNEPIGLSNYLQMFLGLFFVIALIVGMAWFMRRMGNMSGANAANLKVIGGLSIGQRERIVLVQAGNTQLLVGVAPGEIRTLHVMDELITETTDSNSSTNSSFADKLHSAIKNRNNA